MTTITDLIMTNAGPRDLARILDEHPSTSKFCHLDSGKRSELLELAYHVSLRPEEGRHPQFRLFAPHTDSPPARFCDLVRFGEPQSLNAESLRRLAPAFPARHGALVIGASADGLVIRGAMTTTYPQGIVTPGEPNLWANYSRDSGLLVAVDGPGEMRVTMIASTHRIRAGEIRNLIPFDRAPGIRDWLDECGSAITTNVSNQHGVDSNWPGEPGRMGENVRYLFARILERVVWQRHGGAFLITSTDGLDRVVDCRFRLDDVDLGRHLQAFWLASYQVAALNQRGFERKYLRARKLLDNQLYALASLANVDGCVVLTRDLRVIGFGGRILVSDDEARRSHLRLRHPLEDETNVGGNRHQSALRFCRAVPNSLALVVSQDGDLTVFDSTDEEVGWSPNLVPDTWL